MSPFKIGAQIVQRPPSPLHYLLAGMGQGIETGVERALRDKERQKSLVGQILEQVAMGQVPSEWFATPEAQDWLRSVGIHRHPQIQELMTRGQAATIPSGRIATTPSGMAQRIPPTYGMPQYLEERRQAEAGLRRRKFYEEELPQEIEKKRITREIEEAYRPDPRESMERIRRVAKENNLEVGNLTFDPETGKIHADFVTPFEKAKELRTVAEKQADAKDKYNVKITEGLKYKVDASKYITGIKSGEPISAMDLLLFMSPLLKEKSIDTLAKRTALMEPEKRAKFLIKEFNNVIEAKNKEIEDLGKRAGMPPSDLFKIEKMDESMLEEPEEEEPTVGGKVGQILTLPKKAKEPTAEEIEIEAQKILAFTQIPNTPIKPMTIEQARILAKKKLLKKK